MGSQLEEALEVLGIPAHSDRNRVTNAYRRLARLTHPDVSSDPDAAARFAALTAAYRLVSASPAHSRISGRAAASPSSSGSPVPRPPGSRGPHHGVSPYLRADSPGRPPIVAGPVMVWRATGGRREGKA